MGFQRTTHSSQRTTRLRWVVAGGTMAAMLWAAPVRGEPKVSELTAEGWREVATTRAEGPVDAALARAEALLAEGNDSASHQLALQWLQEHPKDAPHRDLALFLVGQSLYEYGDRIRAYYYFDELMDEQPGSGLFAKALQRQYDIADAYLRGYKRRFLRLPIIGAEDEAIEMLYRIQMRSPGSPLAEKALLRTADYYFAEGDYDLAADVYNAYARSYPRSPEMPRVLLRQAFSNFAQFKGLRFDATPLVNARAQLIDVMSQYPELAGSENLAALVGRIDRTFARKILVTADFYRRTGEPTAAAWNYRFLIETYPNSPEADEARRELAKLPESAKEGARPRAGEGYVPATQPMGAP